MNNSHMIVGRDGNIVVKDNNNKVVWSSGVQPGNNKGSLGLMNNLIVRYNPTTMQFIPLLILPFGTVVRRRIYKPPVTIKESFIGSTVTACVMICQRVK